MGTEKKPRLVLSAHAVAGRGGQGMNLANMIEGLGSEVALSVFSSGDDVGLPHEVVPESLWNEWILKTPWVRRFNDWRTIISEFHFDRYVAGRLPQADIFQGVVGQCEESLKRAQKLGARTVLDVINTHIEEFEFYVRKECSHFGTRSFIHPWMRERILREYEQADLVRVMSVPALNTFLERGFPQDRLVVVHPFVEVDQFPRADFSQPLFRICFVGLLEPWKGFHYLIEAFDALNLQDSELVLWGGPGSRPVARYLEEKMGRNPRIQLRPVEVRKVGYASVYASSSVFVLPSLSDGFGYAAIEAMACGLPVILTSRTGASELVVDGKNGYVVPAADSESLRDRLAYLAEHPSLIKTMGENAREFVRALSLEDFRRRFIPRLRALL